MTQFTYMAIKVANEFQFNQVAERLRGMGYYEDADPTFSEWHHDVFECNFDYHILTYKDGEFSIHHHKGGDYRTYFSFEQFMQNHDDSDLVATEHTPDMNDFWIDLDGEDVREVLCDLLFSEVAQGVDYCDEVASRIVACVNACSGMSDPAKEIKALRSIGERQNNTIRTMTRKQQQQLYDYMSEQHNVSLLISDMQEIERILTPNITVPKPTTVLGWLEFLPDGYRERAIGQYDEKFVVKEIATWGQPKEMQGAIRNFALWETTIERGDFWYDVYEHYRSGTPLPELPTVTMTRTSTNEI